MCRDVVVAGSPRQVQDYVADLSHMERWWPEHRRYRRLSGNGGVGTRYYWIFMSMGAILAGFTRIDEVQPGLLCYHPSLAGIPIRFRWEFQPTPGGTLVRGQVRAAVLRIGLVRKNVIAQMERALRLLAQVPWNES